MLIAGIDLGTCNSAISLPGDGRPIIVPNRYGENTTPSVVRFLDNGRVAVGKAATRTRISDPRRTVVESKRLIGRYFNEVLDVTSALLYEVIPGDRNLATIRIEHRDYLPQQVAAYIIRELIDAAETFAGEPVTRAVIGVPAYFSDRQRIATANAAKIAGIEPVRLVAEPTLAALCYGWNAGRDETIETIETIAILDLGAGTFDVSLLELGEGVTEPKAVSGDNFLGGNDFDYALRGWIINEIRIESGQELADDPSVLQLILDAATEAKVQLSSSPSATVVLPFLVNARGTTFSFETTVSVAKFEEICAELFGRLVRPCERALRDAELSVDKIDRVLLVGGASRMPGVVEFARDFFQKEPQRAVNPEEAIALGAGVQAGVLSGRVKNILLLDCIPLSLGIEAADGGTIAMLSRNTTIPARKSTAFSTAIENQTSVELRIVEGEHVRASANRTLGRLVLDGIPPAPVGVADIEVTFDIDANGILNVTALDRASGLRQGMTARPGDGLTKADLERLRASVTSSTIE